jgi:hypothetical protein
VIYRKSLTLQLHCRQDIPLYAKGLIPGPHCRPSLVRTSVGKKVPLVNSNGMVRYNLAMLPTLSCGGNAGIGDYPGYATYSVLPLDRRQCRDRELTMQGTKNDESRLYRREAEPLSLPET